MFSNTGVTHVIKNYKFPTGGKKKFGKQWGTKYKEGIPETQRQTARRARDKT
jgi:hypothetical protein